MDDNKSLKWNTIIGTIWKFGERISTQAVNFIVSIILARLLLPDDYGLIALVTVFITICNKVVVSGFATSLVQKKDADNLDFSTVFYFSLAVAAVLYAGLFFAAPFIAEFYSAESDPELFIQVIRVMGLNFFIVGGNSVQQAYVSRTMQFRKIFFSTLIGTVTSAIVGIGLAYGGYGVWALVAQSLILAVINGIVLWFMVKWRPHLKFSFKRLKVLYSYGWKIFVASIIKTIYADLRSLVIGKVYTSADVAFYNKGQSFPQIVESLVSGAIESVLFPAISKKQSSKTEILAILRRAIKISTYTLMPIFVGLAAISESLITILLTEKWLPSVIYMQILCFSFMLMSVEMDNLQAIKAMGRSDIVLKVETIKKVIGVILLIISIPFGIKAIAISVLVGSVIFAIVDAIPNIKLLGYSLAQQFKDIFPALIMSFIMFAVVYSMNFLNINMYLLMILQIVVGTAIYITLSLIFKVESFKYLLNLVKEILKKKGKKNES